MTRDYKPKRRDMLPLWTDAYLADTTHLDLRLHGAYLLLLIKAWRMSGTDSPPALPDDDNFLKNTLSISTKIWKQIKPEVMFFWTLKNGQWTQKKLTEAWENDMDFRRKQSEAAKKRSQKLEDNEDFREHLDPEKNQQKQRTRGSPAEAEAEANNIPPNGGSAKSKKPPKRKTQWKDGWKPKPLSKKMAEKLNLTSEELRGEYEKFRDNCKAHGRKYINWDAAWTNWLQSDYGTYGRRLAKQSNQANGKSNARQNGSSSAGLGGALEREANQNRKQENDGIVDVTPRSREPDTGFLLGPVED